MHTSEFAATQVLLDNVHGEDLMDFRLVVRGSLPPHRPGTVTQRHRIRRELHPQLKVLWTQHPILKNAVSRKDPGTPIYFDRAANFARCGFRFAPLITTNDGALCSLDVLILQRDHPHAIFTNAGDLDNRVKTLLDALQVPRQCSEIGDSKPLDGEDPFFVLMEDDKLVYEINVTTDRLLVPLGDAEDHRDVVAIIRVKTRVVDGNPISVFGVS